MVALIEIRAEDVSHVKEKLQPKEYVSALYELMGEFNIGIIVEAKNKKELFDIAASIREFPQVKETKTHFIHDGVVI
jgi:DNA-binding Lrp family transcriptional regulator